MDGGGGVLDANLDARAARHAQLLELEGPPRGASDGPRALEGGAEPGVAARLPFLALALVLLDLEPLVNEVSELADHPL
jgi:hypothetical protein